MCNQCDYKQILKSAFLDPTEKRFNVLKTVGNSPFPLSAADIHTTLDQGQSINRVTVYRILDLLVDRQIIERISTGGRAACYGLAPNERHKAHPHFYCKSCGRMNCLNPEIMTIEMSRFHRLFAGRIDKLEMRLDGVCKNCLNQ
jgi:Fur family transcriptional regulator, ferric uptake regulator